jgi:4-hydroxy-3-methylbut-2-enyl diphosphate reductase
MKIIIDQGAGVCPGVARAIRLAEENLAQKQALVAVGPLIHNEVEVARLSESGLLTVPQEAFEASGEFAARFKGNSLLVRAHGISPALRKKFETNGFKIIDATCPKVQRVQQLIKKYSAAGFQVVIVGKKNHPEVIGLAGSATGKAFIILTEAEVGTIFQDQKTVLVAQTTTNQENFEKIAHALKLRIPELVVENTICRSVSNRHQRLQEFARSCDGVVFVGGKHSSNTRELFVLCQQANFRSYRIEKGDEIDFQWFEGAETVGVSGSASTPVWQLEEIAGYLTAHYKIRPTKINIKEVHLNG